MKGIGVRALAIRKVTVAALLGLLRAVTAPLAVGDSPVNYMDELNVDEMRGTALQLITQPERSLTDHLFSGLEWIAGARSAAARLMEEEGLSTLLADGGG